MSSQKRDYYEVLGVPKTATELELKTAFRKIALEHHPDRNPDNPASEDIFKEAAEAYEVLSTPEKRARYDRMGHAGLGSNGGGYAADFGSMADIFAEIFGDFFGTRSRGPARGADLRLELSISFEEAAFGKQTEIKVPKTRACAACEGSGSKSKKRQSCQQCGGSGHIQYRQGFFALSRTCSICHGKGTFAQDACTSCQGEGQEPYEAKLDLSIPPGVDHGTRLRLQGEGASSEEGGPPGDLYVFIHVREHPLFIRNESDVWCELPISIVQAALGAELEVPTLDGPVKMKIPEGTQTGTIFRLRGKGIVRLGSQSRGDQRVRVMLETPMRLSPKQRELLAQFAAECGEEVNPQSRSFFQKVKDLFDNK
ncbi:MAG: molecular chaperone DnaJ [Cystobacterineae bacterium]|nr:molecular chaperone DnaJ [Cystobacterineae bacterium]